MKTITNDHYPLWKRILGWGVQQTATLYYNSNGQKGWGLSPQELLACPSNSLGHKLGEFYINQNIRPIPKAEIHDVFHVLLNYSTTIKDEGRLQFFFWGNGKGSFASVGTSFAAMILFPAKWREFRESYELGKKSINASAWDFKSLINQDLDELRTKILKK